MPQPAAWGLTHRLFAVVTVLVIVLASVATLAWAKLAAVGDLAELTGAMRVPQLKRMADLELNITRVSLQLRHSMLARTPAERQAALADIGEKKKQIDELMAAFEQAISTDGGRARLAQLKPKLDKFWQVGGANIALVQQDKVPEAFAFLVDNTIPARNEVLSAMSDTVKYQAETLASDLARIQNQARNTLQVLVGAIVLATVGLLAFSLYMAKALRNRLALAQAVADRVRQGDLTVAVRDDARDEFSPLLTALGGMQNTLSELVGQVRHNAESVATASGEIAQGNNDLSQRTEQQATALQQTAATMDELSTTVRHNADNAQQANQLARNASTVATQGGAVVRQVVDTMRSIHDSSKRIADIIGTIDGIAFQTNILALNAAVEAARAGEQGRGFAVVAGEVRSLAQRSAEAAKEIKGLITASVGHVDHGSSLVSQAGQTMDEIVNSIQRVSDIVGEISSASAEQSSSVGQVGQAVSQLDQTTQQNAALVEESAAAADSLRAQARALVDQVAQFKLGRALA